MNDVEKVKQVCKERKIPISKLEKDLGFANGYVGQLKKGYFPSDRASKISVYLGIELGTTTSEITCNSDDMAQDESERELLLLCRNATEADPKAKAELVELFRSTADVYLKAKGLK